MDETSQRSRPQPTAEKPRGRPFEPGQTDQGAHGHHHRGDLEPRVTALEKKAGP